MTSKDTLAIQKLYVAYFTTSPGTTEGMIKSYESSHYPRYITPVGGTVDKESTRGAKARLEITRLEKKNPKMANVMKSQEARKGAAKAFLQRYKKR